MRMSARAATVAHATSSSAPATRRASRAHLDPWRLTPIPTPWPTLEVHVAEHEVPDPAWMVIALEAVTVIETDVSEQRDLHAEADARAHLELPGVDLAPLVPDVAGVEEEQTVQGVRNRELLLHREQAEITAARVTDSRDARDQVRVPRGGVVRRRVRGVEVVELGRHDLVVVVAAQRIHRVAAAEAEADVVGHGAPDPWVRVRRGEAQAHHRRDALEDRRQVGPALGAP